MPTASDLRDRITIQSITQTPDGGTNLTPAYPAVASDIAAQVITQSGVKKLNGQSIEEGGGTHLFTIRHRTDVLSKHFVSYDGRRFRILGMSNVDERKVWLELTCEEVQDG